MRHEGFFSLFGWMDGLGACDSSAGGGKGIGL